MRFDRSQKRERTLAVDFTSMVDVVFLLIIFFMTTAQFARITRAELDLPKEAGEQPEQPDEAGLVINITQTGEIIVGDETFELEALRGFVEREIQATYEGRPSDVKLMIRADRRCDTARLNAVVSMLRELNVAVTRVATEVPRGGVSR